MRDKTRDKLNSIMSAKLNEGVKPSTVNRMLEVVRAILGKAEREGSPPHLGKSQREWEIDRAPNIRMLNEDNRRIRWITKEEAQRLIQRRAYGFRNFENYRLRVRVLCG